MADRHPSVPMLLSGAFEIGLNAFELWR
jgi:hypothetical protein